MPHGSEEDGPRMIVFEDRVEFIREDGGHEVYREGKQTEAARERYNYIKSELDDGYLEDRINRITNSELDVSVDVSQEHLDNIDAIVDAITSEKGRALSGLLCGQLTIKSIAPEQSVRLHKGSNSSAHFSWKEGLSMRTIDSNYIAPTLRDHDLLRVNRDGVMMTRSLAENYPYSRFYKANIRGAQEEWAEILSAVESENGPDPEELLDYLLLSFYNRGERAQEAYESVLSLVDEVTERGLTQRDATRIISEHVSRSDHAARIFEVALHSLFQVKEDNSGLPLGYELKPLTQMRSANKKHGNIGDLEVVAQDAEGRRRIREAWDAKYGLRDLATEIKEVGDKLSNHPETEIVGLITSEPVTASYDEIIEGIESKHGVDFRLTDFESFVRAQFEGSEGHLSPEDWITAYAESLCQQRRDRAPIDEPTREWVKSLGELLQFDR